MDINNFKKTKFACYFTYLALSSVFSLPPLLFAAFKELYGISYTLLGTLVLINFCTQLGIDLVFSFFSKHFNTHKILRVMPLITSSGLCIYALIPMLFPKYAYVGFVVGTFVFSVAAGLCEVLVSPTIAALPSDNPERDMSMLHSLYAYGFVTVVIVSTLFLNFIGKEYWMYLTFFWAVLPVIAFALLMSSPLPDMNKEQKADQKVDHRFRVVGLALCMLCIFLGACAENTMSNWISAFSEKALNLPKVWGDVFGMCLFGILLGLARTAYAKFGKNIYKVMLVSMACSIGCYIVVAFSPGVAVPMVACVALGGFTSMLWPGTLIFMEEKIPSVGVAAYALMAAGGDLGASVGAQSFGIIVDTITATKWAESIGNTLSLTAEQVGFRTAMISIAVVPLLGTLLLIYMKKFFNRNGAK